MKKKIEPETEQPEVFKGDMTWTCMSNELIRNGTWAKLSCNAKSVYPVIKTYMGWESGSGSPSIDTLQKYSGLARASVIKALKELEEEGLLIKTTTKGKHSTYQLVEKFGVKGEEWLVKYEAAIKRETDATKQLKILAAKLAKECYAIWHQGDGNGGYVISVIEEEMYKYVNRPSKPEPPLRNSIPKKTQTLVLERNAYRCVHCGDYKQLVIDHIHPVSKGGSDDPDNLQTLCWSCNAIKGNKVA